MLENPLRPLVAAGRDDSDPDGTPPTARNALVEFAELERARAYERASLAPATLRAHVIEPLVRLDVVADDPDDNRVLECAVAGRADCIVSGDRHLLRLGAFEGTPILTVRQFMEAGGF